jgi:hypothetical protein
MVYLIILIILVSFFSIGYLAGYNQGQNFKKDYENTLVQIIKEYRDKYGSLEVLK